MKTAKHFLSLFTTSLTVLILSGFLSLQPIAMPKVAFAQVASDCGDITGSTTEILSPANPGRQSGIGDSGKINFDLQPPALSYHACYGRTPVANKNPMKGWAWNSNFGYMSFMCNAGVNQGGNCGAVNYQTTVNGGQVEGWAWNDNTGWISMMCGADGKNAGLPCGAIPYTGVKIASPADEAAGNIFSGCGPLKFGDFYGYAWSDTMGWVNFCGANANILGGLKPEPKIIISDNDGGGSGIAGEYGISVDTATSPVYANGSDSYKIVVKINDKNGAPQYGADIAGYDPQVTAIWDNQLRANQVDVGSWSAPNDGTILPNFFPFDLANMGYTGQLKAISPTSTTDYIQLNSLSVKLAGFTFIYDVNRKFDFKPAVSISRIYAPSDSSATGTTNKLFAQNKMSVEHKFVSELHSGDAVPAANVIKLFAQLYDCSSDFNFLFDENGLGITDIDGNPEDFADYMGTTTPFLDQIMKNDRPNIEKKDAVCSGSIGDGLSDIDGTSTSAFGATLKEYVDAGGTLGRYIYTASQNLTANNTIAADNALGMRMRVEYRTLNPKIATVRYFLPPIKDSSLTNQAADVVGNVRIDVQNLEGIVKRVEKSAGERMSQKRAALEKAINIAELKTPFVPLTNNTTTLKVADIASSLQKMPASKFIERTNGSLTPCTIKIDDEATGTINLSDNNKTTVVSRGCNVFINANILPATGQTGGALGIIAMKDLTMEKGKPQGGNIYICSKVTDLSNLHLVVEGSIFSYGKSSTECGDPNTDGLIDIAANRMGLPKFVNPISEVLKNQLTINGSLISNNTYGGSLKTPPETGDGTIIKNIALADTARFYDVNFWRYARTKIPDPALNIGKICWADDVKLSTLKAPPGAPYNYDANRNPPYSNWTNICKGGSMRQYPNNPDKIGIVNVQYTAPPKDLPVFGF